MNTPTVINFEARRQARAFDDALKAIRLKEARSANRKAPVRANKAAYEVRVMARAAL